MAALGYNPLVAIQIALAGNAADMIKIHDAKPALWRGEQIPIFMNAIMDPLPTHDLPVKNGR